MEEQLPQLPPSLTHGGETRQLASLLFWCFWFLPVPSGLSFVAIVRFDIDSLVLALPLIELYSELHFVTFSYAVASIDKCRHVAEDVISSVVGPDEAKAFFA